MNDGAEHDKKALALAITALGAKDIDGRWKIYLEKALVERERAYGDKKIESNIPSAPTTKPKEIKKEEREVDILLGRAKERLVRHETTELKEKTPPWPGLEEELREKTKSLDIASCTELAVALHMMGFNELAIKVLRRHKKTWDTKHKLLHIDFYIASGRYLEALEEAESLMKADPTNSDLLYACLYDMAQAQAGLKDWDRAVAILKALALHRPDYRDVQRLLAKWTSRHDL
jgi:predicted Zn-dependent protease